MQLQSVQTTVLASVPNILILNYLILIAYLAYIIYCLLHTIELIHNIYMKKHTYIVGRSFKGLHDAIWKTRRLLITFFPLSLLAVYDVWACLCLWVQTHAGHSTCVELRNQPYIIFLTFYLFASGYSRLSNELPKILLPTPPIMKSTRVQYHAQLYMCNTMPSSTCAIPCPALHV